jgi:HlyD family secretion protein
MILDRFCSRAPGRARLGVAIALALSLCACGRGDPNVLAASGTVEATDAQLGFQAAGRIVAIHAREGESVAAGAPLATLDAAETEAKRRQSEAALAAARARLAELSRGFRAEEIAQARADLDGSEQRLADAERELARATRLFEGGAISRESLDKTVLARDLASSQRSRAREQLDLLSSGYRKEQVEAARAQVAQAEAALAAADAALGHLRIAAPFAGTVTLRHREPGEVVAAGAPVLTVMNPADRWVRIYVREDRIGAVDLGAKADIRCDTFPDRTYSGEVTFIASEAEFTPKNVQTTEERVKLVYAVKVRVRDDDGQDLKPGMPADVTLRLDSAPPGESP